MVTIEDGALIGGFGSAVSEFRSLHNYSAKLICKGIPDEFIDHGSIPELQDEVGLSEATLKVLLDSLI